MTITRQSADSENSMEKNAMKVFYDHQIFELQNIGGISRYFAELIKFNDAAQLGLRYTDNIYLRDAYFKKYKLKPAIGIDRFITSKGFKGKYRLFQIYKKVRNNINISINRLKKSNFEVFHPTYYDPYFLQYLKNKPFVLTVHDMIYELFPEYFMEDKYTVQNKKLLISSANRINVNSVSTKNDLLRLFPETENKITVVYHACSFTVSDSVPEKENYILFTGTRSGYKNFNNFIKAVAPLLISYNLKLVCTGHGFNSEEKELLESLNIAGKTICKYVSDTELQGLYAKALAFVFPSLYEGFGIPVLEAFAAGAPAVLANTSSLPEIGANAAVYFDPYSIDDMRNKIEYVITSPAIQRELMEKGKARAKQFSWEKCAGETQAVYQKLV